MALTSSVVMMSLYRRRYYPSCRRAHTVYSSTAPAFVARWAKDRRQIRGHHCGLLGRDLLV